MPERKSAFLSGRTASHPLRVLFVFGLGIIIPSGVLSFLGFRSLQIEGMLLHKQAEDRYSALADLMQRNINDLLNGLIQDVRHDVAQPAFQNGSLKGMTETLLKINTLGSIDVQSVYVFDYQGHLVVPALLSENEKDARVPVELNWGIYSEDLHHAERLEFVQKNIPQAIKGYQALLEQVNTSALRAALLKNIAGANRKAGNYEAAEAYYQELLSRYDQLPDTSRLPFGLLGRQLLAEVYDASGQTAKARTLRLDLAQSLIVGQWPLGQRQTDVLLAELHQNLFQNVPEDSPAYRPLRERWDPLQALAARLTTLRVQAQSFLRTSWPALENRIQRNGAWDQGGFFLLNEDHSLRLAVPAASASGTRYLVVAEVAPTSIFQMIQQTLEKLMRSSGVRVEFGGVEKAPSVGLSGLASTLQPRVVRSLPLIDPLQEIRLLEDSKTQESLRRRWTWIYFGMIGMSILVIVVGLGVMAQAIRREIEVANMKADFVANVSHELRTPLSAISYIGERLSLGRYRSNDEVHEFYDMLGEETGRLRELIEDILDFSKMLDGRKAYKKEPADLVETAKEAANRIHGKAEAKGFQIETQYPDRPLIVPIDRKAVIQSITNLLDNAIKYSGDSRTILLRIREADGWAVAEVLDHGIGVSPQDQAKIFEKFYRVEESLLHSSEGGVGLGLAMVKHIVEGHGGRVDVASTPGKGSTFSLWFQMKEVRGMTRILIVEDDPKLVKLLSSDFELEGYTVLTAGNGLDGYDKAKREKPDLIILDVMMPKMNGYDVCRSLRKDGADVPIIMLTAKGQESEKVIGLDLGADDYITKPFSGMELLARVKALLRRHNRELKKVETVEFDDIKINFKGMDATRAGKPLGLTTKEFQILELLIRHEGEVVSRRQFLEEIWGYDELPATRTVDNQVLTLRQKLAGKNPKAKEYIHTLHGIGYKFVR